VAVQSSNSAYPYGSWAVTAPQKTQTARREIEPAIVRRGEFVGTHSCVEFLDAEIAAVEKLIAQEALSWPEIRRLMTVHGVNLICAASFIATVGNVNRFLTTRKLVAYSAWTRG
jgi:hypothetical protein